MEGIGEGLACSHSKASGLRAGEGSPHAEEVAEEKVRCNRQVSDLSAKLGDARQEIKKLNADKEAVEARESEKKAAAKRRREELKYRGWPAERFTIGQTRKRLCPIYLFVWPRGQGRDLQSRRIVRGAIFPPASLDGRCEPQCLQD